MSAQIFAFPVPANPVEAIRRAERETGLVARLHGPVVMLEPKRVPVADASTTNPSDPNGPRAA